MTEPMLNDLDFEQRISELSDRELMEFTAREVFGMRRICDAHGQRITTLEERGSGLKAAGGFGGFVGGTIAGLVYGLIVLIKGHT